MSVLEQVVLAALRDHPHHDTLPLLLDRLRGPEADGDAVAEALERLRSEGLVITADGHWQLTAAGFRLQRAA